MRIWLFFRGLYNGLRNLWHGYAMYPGGYETFEEWRAEWRATIAKAKQENPQDWIETDADGRLIGNRLAEWEREHGPAPRIRRA